MFQQGSLIGHNTITYLDDRQSPISRPLKDLFIGHIVEPKMDQVLSDPLGTIEYLTRITMVVFDYLRHDP